MAWDYGWSARTLNRVFSVDKNSRTMVNGKMVGFVSRFLKGRAAPGPR
jgi:hypothetical protein